MRVSTFALMLLMYAVSTSASDEKFLMVCRHHVPGDSGLYMRFHKFSK